MLQPSKQAATHQIDFNAYIRMYVSVCLLKCLRAVRWDVRMTHTHTHTHTTQLWIEIALNTQLIGGRWIVFSQTMQSDNTAHVWRLLYLIWHHTWFDLKKLKENKWRTTASSFVTLRHLRVCAWVEFKLFVLFYFCKIIRILLILILQKTTTIANLVWLLSATETALLQKSKAKTNKHLNTNESRWEKTETNYVQIRKSQRQPRPSCHQQPGRRPLAHDGTRLCPMARPRRSLPRLGSKIKQQQQK